MELVVGEDGLWTDKSVRDLADWYNGGGPDQLTFEAHLMMLRAYGSLVTSAQRGRRTNMSIERYSLLRLLYLAPQNRLLMTEISKALNVSPTSVTKLVNALSEAGLVQRTSDVGDKRRIWTAITDEGQRIVEEALPSVREYTRARWSSLSDDEKRVLVHLLTKLVLSMQAPNATERVQLIGATSSGRP